MNDNDTDNMIKSECDQIKDQIKPSDELINKTILKVRKVQEERTYKKLKNRKLLTKVLGTFTAIVIVAEGATFAFKKQDVLSMLFSKVDKGIETAIEYGDIKNVDMDYIEIKDGLKMKAEFVLMNEYNFDLVFKFDGLEEYCSANGIKKIEKIHIPDLIVNDNLGNSYSSISSQYLSTFKNTSSFIVDNNIYYFLHCYNINNAFPTNSIENFNVSFSKIDINDISFDTSAKLSLEFDNLNLDTNSTYYNIKKQPDYIEKYNIVLSSTNLKVELYLKDIENNIDKESIYLKDNNRNIYYPNNDFLSQNNYALLVFPISNYQEIDSLNLFITINGNKTKLNLKPQS